jgi:hypothetical protein
VIFYYTLMVHPLEGLACDVHSVRLCCALPRNHTDNTQHNIRSWSITVRCVPPSGLNDYQRVHASLWPVGQIANRWADERRALHTKGQETTSAERSIAVPEQGDRDSLQNVEQVLNSENGQFKRICHSSVTSYGKGKVVPVLI